MCLTAQVQKPVFGFDRVDDHIHTGRNFPCQRGMVFCQNAMFRCRVDRRTPLRGDFFRRRVHVYAEGLVHESYFWGIRCT